MPGSIRFPAATKPGAGTRGNFVTLNVFPGNDPDFLFWIPEADDVVLVGPEQRQVPLPLVPIPIHAHLLAAGERPSDDDIGTSVYDYLRRYPDAEGGYWLADLLRNAYPHFLADIASQVIMLDEKEVDAAYIRRKLTGLKFLALLDPQPQLLYLLGKTYFDLGVMFAELPHCRHHFLTASEYLRRSLALQQDTPAALNLLAQINYWFGDLAEAADCWRKAANLLINGPTRTQLLERVAAIEAEHIAVRPLVDDLEALGETLTLIGSGAYGEALTILEQLEAEGRVVEEIPTAEFYYLLGYCRERTEDFGAALIAYDKALVIDPEYEPAREGFDRIGRSQANYVR